MLLCPSMELTVSIGTPLERNTVVAAVWRLCSSSKWIKSLGPSYHDFSWQEGYGAFSVSQSKVETVTRYILGQKEHHKKMTFQDELKMFLKEYQVEYNEEFI